MEITVEKTIKIEYECSKIEFNITVEKAIKIEYSVDKLLF